MEILIFNFPQKFPSNNSEFNRVQVKYKHFIVFTDGYVCIYISKPSQVCISFWNVYITNNPPTLEEQMHCFIKALYYIDV